MTYRPGARLVKDIERGRINLYPSESRIKDRLCSWRWIGNVTRERTREIASAILWQAGRPLNALLLCGLCLRRIIGDGPELAAGCDFGNINYASVRH